MSRPIPELLVKLGLPEDGTPDMWRQALTHRSAESRPHYERLEFLGDAVLKLVVSQWLYERHPSLDEGDMTKVRARAVSDEALARAAQALDLGAYLILGAAEKRSRGRDKVGILASTFEALLGALYETGGYEAAANFLDVWLATEFADAVRLGGLDNHKAVLQELTQGRYKTLPSYRMVGESGPEHERIYEIEVLVDGESQGVGRGKSKKSAEQAAAAQALTNLALLARKERPSHPPLKETP
jgi:ribonuclease-3